MKDFMTFDKLNNTRDIGGMETLDNRQIVSGKLFRSGQLSDLSLSDQDKLKELGPIIIDFRTDAERSERPDVKIDGIEYVHISVLDDLTAGISREAGSLEELVKPHAVKTTCFLQPRTPCGILGCALGASDCVSTIQP